MSVTITRKQLEEAADQAGLDMDSIRHDYSGRGMYGRTCIGIVTSLIGESMHLANSLAIVLAETELDENQYEATHYQVTEKLHQITGAVQTDSMGCDLIVYFEDIACEMERDDEDEDD